MPIDLYPNKLNNKNHIAADVWDSVASCFKCIDSDKSEYTPSLDNYKAVWPVLSQVIKNQLKWSKNDRVCDFGCGIGKLAEQLHKMKFNTFACDISSKMIEQARLSNSNIIYGIGSTDFLKKYSPFKLITAIMVFQFIDDFDSICDDLSECVERDGILFFAIHDIQYIKECVKYKVKFREKEMDQTSVEYEILIDNHWIKTYTRTPKWYDDILTSKGFVLIDSSLKSVAPPIGISKEFSSMWNCSKYYIAWYKKV